MTEEEVHGHIMAHLVLNKAELVVGGREPNMDVVYSDSQEEPILMSDDGVSESDFYSLSSRRGSVESVNWLAETLGISSKGKGSEVDNMSVGSVDRQVTL